MTAEYKWYKYRFGQNGNLAAIPDDAVGGGDLSLEEGWGSDYEINPDVDPVNAKFMSRAQHNQLWLTATGNINFWQQNLYPLYTPAADNGGVPVVYQFATRVRYDSGGGEKVYEVIDAAGTDEIPTVIADWVLVSTAYPRSGTAGGEQRTNTQNEALFQDTGDYRASADDAGMVARGFTIVDIPPLEEVVTGTTGSFVAYNSYAGATAGAMAVNKITDDLFVAAGTIMYKSAGGTGAFTAIGSYPGSGITGVAVHDRDGHVYACDSSDNVYKLTDGTGSFALFGNYISLSGTLTPADIAVDQDNGDVVVVDTGLDKLVKSMGGEVDFEEMSLAPPANSNCLAIAKGSVYLIGATGDVHRSIYGETAYNTFGSVPSVNAIGNIDYDDISESIFISIFSDAKVYKLTGNGLFAEIGAYPDSNLIGVAASSLLGHVYAADITTPDVYRQTGTIVSAAANWYIKT